MNITATWDLFDRVREKATGYWEVADPKTKRVGRSLAIEDGEIVYARSWYEGERLEDVFLELKILTPSEILDILEKRKRMVDLVSTEDLWRSVEEVAVKVIGHVLKFADKDDKPPKFDVIAIPPGSRMGLDTKNVLLRGVLKAAVGNMALALNGDAEQIATANFDALSHSGLIIPDDLKALVGMLDGTRSLMDIVQESGRTRARIGALIYVLREFEYVNLQMPEMAGAVLSDFDLDYEAEHPVAAGGTLEVAEPTRQLQPVHDMLDELDAAAQVAPVVIEAPVPQRMELVTPRFKDSAEVAQAYGIRDDTQETAAVLVPEIIEMRYSLQTPSIDDMDPRLGAFVEAMRALQPKPFPMMRFMAGMVFILALFAGGILWFVSARIPNLRGGPRPRITPVGEVKLDRQSRATALMSLDLQVALAQGSGYLKQLQREDPDQWTIRLGIAVQSRQVHPLLGVLGDWSKEDVFLVPIELEGQKDCYQVFFGTFKDQNAAREAMQRFEGRAHDAKMTVAPFNVLGVPQSQ